MKKSKEAVTFKAFIYKLDSTTQDSGDKRTRLTVQLDNANNDILDSLNHLHQGYEFVNVGVWPYIEKSLKDKDSDGT